MDRQNVLLITTDQQRFDTIHALGNRDIYTPHLNWLADTSMAYTRCYTDSPVCAPARATIMTGLHGYETGLVGNSNWCPMQKHPTLPGILTGNGYQTRAQGKMHFTPMRAHYGFESMELPMDYYRAQKKKGFGFLPKAHGVGENEIEPVISTVNETESLTHWTVERSVDFLETRDDTRPFFLWTSFTKPHPPLDPCAHYWELYRDRPIPERVLGDWSQSIDTMPQGFLKSCYQLNSAYRMSSHQLDDVKRAYYACITEIDYSLGLLFTRMRELNLLENTWIIFTSDHGDMMGDHHMGAKMTFFEGSCHVPLLIRPPHGSWEKHSMSGKSCSCIVELNDLMPTILAMCGVEPPANLSGRNLLETENLPKEFTFYGNCEDSNLAIMKNGYKYMWTAYGGEELLFHLDTDPMEQHNLAPLSDYKEVKEQLREQLVARFRETGTPLVEGNCLVSVPAIRGPGDVPKWPGFHSLEMDADCLH